MPTLSSPRGPVYALLLGITGIALLRRRVVSVTVRGESMEPALHDGERVLVLRGGRLAVGRVVVVERMVKRERWTRRPFHRDIGPAQGAKLRWFIKRIAAMPGDPVPLEGVAPHERTPGGTVPSGKLVLLGDNPSVSYDSRQAGYFPAERVLGTVLFRSQRP